MGKAVRNGRLVVLPPTSWSHVSNRAPLRLDAWPIQGAQKYRPSTNNRLVSTDVALSFTGLHIHRSLAPPISINLRNSSVLSRTSFSNGTQISYSFRTCFDRLSFDEWVMSKFSQHGKQMIKIAKMLKKLNECFKKQHFNVEKTTPQFVLG